MKKSNKQYIETHGITEMTADQIVGVLEAKNFNDALEYIYSLDRSMRWDKRLLDKAENKKQMNSGDGFAKIETHYGEIMRFPDLENGGHKWVPMVTWDMGRMEMPEYKTALEAYFAARAPAKKMMEENEILDKKIRENGTFTLISDEKGLRVE